MTKEELRAKYARIPADFSEIEMLKDQLLESGLLEAAQVDQTQAGKVFGVLEDGSIGLVEGGGSAQTPVKGGYVMIDGHRYLVLDANADLTEVKLMFADFNDCKYYARSLGSEMLETFTLQSSTVKGLKYAGSTLDTYCNETFLATLPQEVQDAIIEKNVVQDMYDIQSTAEGNHDFTVEVTWGGNYAVDKVNTDSIMVGNRKIRSLCIADIIEYFGNSVTNTELNNFIFDFDASIQINVLMTDAVLTNTHQSSGIYGAYGGIWRNDWSTRYVVRPVFIVNWKAFN